MASRALPSQPQAGSAAAAAAAAAAAPTPLLLQGHALADLLSAFAPDCALPAAFVQPLLAHLRRVSETRRAPSSASVAAAEAHHPAAPPADTALPAAPEAAAPTATPRAAVAPPPSPHPALHHAVQVFEARYGDATTADLRAFHTQGFLHLRAAVDAAAALHALEHRTTPFPWVNIPDTFGGKVNPRRRRPYRQMCDACGVHLPLHLDPVTSMKLLRSRAGVLGQQPHMDGPHDTPLLEGEVPPYVAIGALHPNTPITLFPGAIHGRSWRDCPPPPPLPADLFHAGAAYTDADISCPPHNLRAFFYFGTVDHPEYRDDHVNIVAEEEEERASVAVAQPPAGQPAAAASANDFRHLVSRVPATPPTPSSPKRTQAAAMISIPAATPAKRRKAAWSRRRYIQHKQARATNTPLLNTTGLGQRYLSACDAIRPHFTPDRLAAHRLRYARLSDASTALRDRTLRLPAPHPTDADPQWRGALDDLLGAEASTRYNLGLLLLVLARHLEIETRAPPSFDAVFARLEQAVGDVGKFTLKTAHRHYYYALALDAHPGLAALPLSYAHVAQAWQGTLKVRKLRAEHPNATGLDDLPVPLDELDGFVDAMAAIALDQPLPPFLRAASTEPATAALDAASALVSLQLTRGDDSGLGSDGDFAEAVAARCATAEQVLELTQGLATVGDGLAVRQSILIGAGLGLFATRPFRQGELITYYQGQHISEAQAQARRARGEDAFIVTLESMRSAIDGVRADALQAGFGGASACNDASHDARVRAGVAQEPINTAAFVRQDVPVRLLLRALQDIQPGEEIFASYGRASWHGK